MRRYVPIYFWWVLTYNTIYGNTLTIPIYVDTPIYTDVQMYDDMLLYGEKMI